MPYYAPLVERRQPLWRRSASVAVVAGLHLLALFVAFGWGAERQSPETLTALSVRLLEPAPTPPKVVPPKPLPAAPAPRKAPPVPPPVFVAAAASTAPASFVVAPPAEPQPVAVVPAPPAAPAPAPAPVVAARFDADYLQNPKPNYPSMSRRLGEEGKVLLRVRVSPQGLPLAIEIKQSAGFPRLDEAARAAVEKWRFVPAKAGGEAVESWVVVPLRFSLDA